MLFFWKSLLILLMKTFFKIILAIVFVPYAIYLFCGLFTEKKKLQVTATLALSVIFAIFVTVYDDSVLETEAKEQGITVEQLKDQRIKPTKLKEISSMDAYNLFNEEWSVLCKTERYGYEVWRVANIEPMHKEFRLKASNLSQRSKEWDALNKARNIRSEEAALASVEWQALQNCELKYAESKGYVYPLD